MNIFSKIMNGLTGFAAGLAPDTIQFWLRLILLMSLPVAVCAWSFIQGNRSVFIQVLASVFGMLLALSLPLDHIKISSGLARLWLLTFGCVLSVFLPAALPPLIVPTLGAQRKLRKVLYVTMAVLILVNLIWR